jgi:hypothetical protein
MTGVLTFRPHLRRPNGNSVALIRRHRLACPKTRRKTQNLRQKRHSEHAASRERHLSSGIMTDFGDNAINGIVAFAAQARD